MKQVKKPNLSKLRPDIPPQAEKRIKGETHEFRNLTPPILEAKAEGPEQTYQQSIEKELWIILRSSEAFHDSYGVDFWDDEDKRALINKLLQWRRA